MTHQRDRAITNTIQAVNLAASLVTIVPIAAFVATFVLSVVQQPAVAAIAGLTTGTVATILLGRTAGTVRTRHRSNARTGPLLRSALVSIAEAGRDLSKRDPSRGSPSAVALASWSPNLSGVDRLLRRADLDQELLTYLLWLIDETRRATDALHDAIQREDLWRNEWLVARERLSTVACLLLAEADRRRIRDVVKSFAGSPHLARPVDYGDRTMTAANDVAFRGAPPFPSDAAFNICAPTTRGTADLPPADAPPARAFEFDMSRAIGLVVRASATLLVIAGYPIGSAIAFWLMGVFGVSVPPFEWIPSAVVLASAWWVGVFGVSAFLSGSSFTWVGWIQLEDAVLRLDLAAASAAPALGALLAWWSSVAIGFVAGSAGGQAAAATAITFVTLTVVSGLRLIAAHA